VSSWYALIYGLSPALAVAVHRDVAEPLAWAFAALGLMLLGSSRPRLVAAASMFALALLAHEATIVVPVGATIAALKGHIRPAVTSNRKAASLLLTVSLAPALVWRAFLQIAVDEHRPGYAGLEPLPFAGLFRAGWPETFKAPEVVYAVLVPALVGLALVLVARVRPPTPSLYVFALATVFVFSLPKLSFDGFASTGRLSLGTLVAFVLCIPLVDPARRTLVVLPSTVLWASSWMLVAGDYLG
jgi:hypothetical protein